MTKTADPTEVDEPGDTVDFTVTIENTSVASDTVTIDTLTDAVDGGTPYTPTDLVCVDESEPPVTQSVPFDIDPGDTVTCTFTNDVTGNAGDTVNDVFTASGQDDDGTAVSDFDDADVDILDVDPSIVVTKTADPTEVDEPGDTVDFTVTIENTSVASDTVTIDTLTDAVDGGTPYTPTDLVCVDESEPPVTQSVPFDIDPGDTVTCTFTNDVTGNAGDTVNDVFTASGQDDDGTAVSDFDDADVDILDVDPSIVVTKTADPTEVDEPGDTVDFTVTIENTSVASDTVTIDTLTDAVDGGTPYTPTDLVCVDESEPPVTQSVPFDIDPGDTVTCTFTNDVTGNAGDTVNDVFTASGQDDDGTAVSDFDDADVDILDVDAGVNIVKTVDANTDGTFNDSELLLNADGTATYKYQVTNTSPAGVVDPLTIDTLVDDRGTAATGDDKTLVSGGVVQSGVTLVKTGGDQDNLLEVGETWTYTWTAVVPVSAGTPTNTNTATVTARDDEGTSATDDDTASVTFVDYGQIAPTGTTCDQYVNGTAQDFSDYYASQGGVIQYGIKANKINNANPGVFFYYTGLSQTITGAGGVHRPERRQREHRAVRPGAQRCQAVAGDRHHLHQVQLAASQITISNGDVTVDIADPAPAAPTT